MFLISKVELVFELSVKAKYKYQNKEIKKLKMENQGYVSFWLQKNKTFKLSGKVKKKLKKTTENLIISDCTTVHKNKIFLMISSNESVFLKNTNSIHNITSET